MSKAKGKAARAKKAPIRSAGRGEEDGMMDVNEGSGSKQARTARRLGGESVAEGIYVEVRLKIQRHCCAGCEVAQGKFGQKRAADGWAGRRPPSNIFG